MNASSRPHCAQYPVAKHRPSSLCTSIAATMIMCASSSSLSSGSTPIPWRLGALAVFTSGVQPLGNPRNNNRAPRGTSRLPPPTSASPPASSVPAATPSSCAYAAAPAEALGACFVRRTTSVRVSSAPRTARPNRPLQPSLARHRLDHPLPVRIGLQTPHEPQARVRLSSIHGTKGLAGAVDAADASRHREPVSGRGPAHVLVNGGAPPPSGETGWWRRMGDSGLRATGSLRTARRGRCRGGRGRSS